MKASPLALDHGGCGQVQATIADKEGQFIDPEFTLLTT
jgi:hypothetical protein